MLDPDGKPVAAARVLVLDMPKDFEKIRNEEDFHMDLVGRIESDANGRFLPGSPGRPVGARGKASRAVAQAILADFTAHQHEVLPKLRRWFLPQYVALIGRLMPKGGDEDQVVDGLQELDGMDPEAASRLMAAARLAVARIEAGEGTLADLEAALAGGPAAGEGP